MTKRLQVLLQDRVYREIQIMARARHTSVAAWVRQALAGALRREPGSTMQATPGFDRARARRAALGLIKAGRGLRLGGVAIKDLINEGRP